MTRSFVLSRCFLLISAGIASAQTGFVSYSLQKAANPTADQLDAYARIEKAMDSALGYYNAYTTIRKAINVQYDGSVATADASSNGTLRFGSSRSYMYVGTAMHEIAHTVGVGTTAEYQALMVGGVFTGEQATATLRSITGDGAAVLKGDAQHIWPYGLNYASEVKSATDLVNHCRIIESLYRDLYHESTVFSGRVRSRSTMKCMVRSGTSLSLGGCADSGSLVRVVAMGASSPTYRIEFGDRVLDAPNQSSAAGLKMGLYGWNRGTNQQMRIEGGAPSSNLPLRLVMVHSSLSLEPVGSDIVQNPSSRDTVSQAWEFVLPTSSLGEGRSKSSESHKAVRDASGRRRPDGVLPWPMKGF